MKKQIIVGVDGGGTKTACVLLEHTSIRPSSLEQVIVLASATTGSSNRNSVGAEKAKEALIGSITDALVQLVSFPDFEICAFSLCMSGVDRPSDKIEVQKWLDDSVELTAKRSPHAKIFINNDAVGALCSGTMGVITPGKSMVLISGTGMICVGVDEQNQWIRVGGWGPLLGDDGSGYEIGHSVLKTVCNLQDGVKPLSGLLDNVSSSTLPDKVLASVNLKQTSDLIGYVYNGEKTAWSRIANFALLCLECAKEGDELAQQIINFHAESLFRYVDALVQRMGKSARDDGDFSLVISGSILTHDQSMVTEKLSQLIIAKYKHANILLPCVGAAIGSALFAFQSLEQTNS